MMWDARRHQNAAAKLTLAPGTCSTMPTKALGRFLRCLTARQAPVLLDLGPVVGANITFFGERLGCKIIVDDLFADLQRDVREGAVAAADTLSGRLVHAPASVDGILCWDVFDFLDAASAKVLATALTRILRPDGAALGFFTTVPLANARFSKYVIVDEATLQRRPGDECGRKQVPLRHGDIIRMFGGLKVSESFLLKTSIHEFLFRKPPGPAMSDNDSPDAVWGDQLSGY